VPRESYLRDGGDGEGTEDGFEGITKEKHTKEGRIYKHSPTEQGRFARWPHTRTRKHAHNARAPRLLTTTQKEGGKQAKNFGTRPSLHECGTPLLSPIHPQVPISRVNPHRQRPIRAPPPSPTGPSTPSSSRGPESYHAHAKNMSSVRPQAVLPPQQQPRQPQQLQQQQQQPPKLAASTVPVLRPQAAPARYFYFLPFSVAVGLICTGKFRPPVAKQQQQTQQVTSASITALLPSSTVPLPAAAAAATAPPAAAVNANDADWKKSLNTPAKDTRIKTEVCFVFGRLRVMLTGCPCSGFALSTGRDGHQGQRV